MPPKGDEDPGDGAHDHAPAVSNVPPEAPGADATVGSTTPASPTEPGPRDEENITPSPAEKSLVGYGAGVLDLLYRVEMIGREDLTAAMVRAVFKKAAGTTVGDPVPAAAPSRTNGMSVDVDGDDTTNYRLSSGGYEVADPSPK
ncbi:hypothetical protein PybrP1_008640 [[Pythium] brassicae (nom. inval.)]|nr:hypothetical protein PybrP1_008640 [[Pythium] brassicae (nom. inval.)]